MRDRDKKIMEKVTGLTVTVEGTGQVFRFGLDGFMPGMHQVLSFYIGHCITSKLEDAIEAERLMTSPLLSKVFPDGEYAFLLEYDSIHLYTDKAKLEVRFYHPNQDKWKAHEVVFDTELNMDIDLSILSSLQCKAVQMRRTNERMDKKKQIEDARIKKMKADAVRKIKGLSENIKGIYKSILKETDYDRFSFEIAQQAATARDGAIESVGIEIVNICENLYPNLTLYDDYLTYKFKLDKN